MGQFEHWTRHALKCSHLGQVFLKRWHVRVKRIGSRRVRCTSMPSNSSFLPRSRASRRDMHPAFTHPSWRRWKRLVATTILFHSSEYYSWWALVQNWSTLRFNVNRGIRSQNVTVKGGSFSARRIHSKTSGEDREPTLRPVYIDAVCFVVLAELMTVGWVLLKVLADFPPRLLDGLAFEEASRLSS